MTTTLFGLKNCDTCKKAIKAFAATDAELIFVDIRTDADLAALLPGWLDAIGSDRLINTRSTTWRGLDDTARERAKTDPAGLLVEHPTLIKRPVIVSPQNTTVGWSADTLAAHIR